MIWFILGLVIIAIIINISNKASLRAYNRTMGIETKKEFKPIINKRPKRPNIISQKTWDEMFKDQGDNK